MKYEHVTVLLIINENATHAISIISADSTSALLGILSNYMIDLLFHIDLHDRFTNYCSLLLLNIDN
jgi:hypothetical protein